jgi:hypothetical protein
MKVSPKYHIAPQEQRIHCLYQNLSACFDKMQTVIEHLYSPKEIAVAAVLSEDLQSLVEECEEYLIGGCDMASPHIQSFESRSVTVLEELETLHFLERQRRSPGRVPARH